MEYSIAYQKDFKNGIAYYSSPHLNKLGVINAFANRLGGVSTGPYASLNLSSSTGDTEDHVKTNTKRYLEAFSASPETSVKAHQVHKDEILYVTAEKDGGTGLLGKRIACDGLITDDPGLTLLASTADCPLVLLYAPDRSIAAVVHAGWRGTALDIAGKAVSAFIERGASPAEIVAFLPPAIGPRCFETDLDVPLAMETHFKGELDTYIKEIAPARYHVNLQGINAHALHRRGLKPENIEVAPICTCCHEEFFSHRRMKTQRGLSAALIRIAL